MIKLCIFDMDGTLIDSERYMWLLSARQSCKEQGFDLSDDLHRTFMGTSLSSNSEILYKEFGPTFNFDLYLKRMNEINQGIIEKGLPLMKGAKELLEYLNNKHINTCIGTSTNRNDAEKMLKIMNIHNKFTDMVCGNEIEHGKPAPDIYLNCLAKFPDVKKEEALVFEDAENGGLAALAAGLKLVFVPDLAILTEETKAKAYKIINSLDEAIAIIEEENERTTSL